MNQDRRAILSALGLALPFGLFAQASASAEIPMLRLRSFEEAVREAFARPASNDVSALAAASCPCRRVEVGHSELLQHGVQGCVNDRPFAGFLEGHLRIIRTGFEPGPVHGGARLYIATVDILLTGGDGERGERRLDFHRLPPAPIWPEHARGERSTLKDSMHQSGRKGTLLQQDPL